MSDCSTGGNIFQIIKGMKMSDLCSWMRNLSHFKAGPLIPLQMLTNM